MPIVSRSGDTHYINEARRIQDNIQQLLLIASELGSSVRNEEAMVIRKNVSFLGWCWRGLAKRKIRRSKISRK